MIERKADTGCPLDKRVRKNVKRKGIDGSGRKLKVESLKNEKDPPPGGSDVWQTQGLFPGVFGSVAIIGLSRRFFGSVAKKGVSEEVVSGEREREENEDEPGR